MAVSIKLLREFIPPLSTAKHKGEMGKIAIVGGSKEYTGAPYFSAISSLYCGADLVHVICAASAAPIIKTYSPDLIVHPILDNNLLEATGWIERMHAVTFGPGLGLVENAENTSKLINHCRTMGKPMVIDADALTLVNKDLELVKSYQKVILTPNVVEFSRLYQTVFGSVPDMSVTMTKHLAAELGGVTIVRKGPTDVISDGESVVVCEAEGSPRRCGGQGDVLSGVMLTFTNWFHRASSDIYNHFTPTIAAAYSACMLTRRCSNLAFTKYGRSLVTAHILPEIQFGFHDLFEKVSS